MFHLDEKADQEIAALKKKIADYKTLGDPDILKELKNAKIRKIEIEHILNMIDLSIEYKRFGKVRILRKELANLLEDVSL